ncbi:nucleotide exchange factor GrpE [Frankia sp. CNm7]|uniref:Protein GrpE n=1 Tax=Frankia nepalensis TaxID=1836974 RepID=A0A937RQW7_9ACTN|nr:nucleotide exchange factor GrpE [Frankia nepalensis]MBL7509613.1 nucleotide exchange factor GrpE [Frankia nepalensis]MBL7517100.1 nucleotide exchange factor GrpE [Frankia nepalensis]MBL7631028.1 nucleotide exchange factor GrpE [Frankia nepalensis]
MTSARRPPPGTGNDHPRGNRPVGADQSAATDRPVGEARPAGGERPAGVEHPAGADPRDEPAALAARIEELTASWRQALADLDNQRKWCAREVEREREAERARAATAWLPVLDHLELALAHAGADPDSILTGVRAVRDQAVEALARLGYPRHDEVGVPFDPARHDVVSLVDEPGTPPGTVVAVVRPGYGDAGRQLRPVGVAVSKPSE